MAKIAEWQNDISALIFQFFAIKCGWDNHDAELMSAKLMKPVCKEVEETAGSPYTASDVEIAIRRCIMRKYKLLDV